METFIAQTVFIRIEQKISYKSIIMYVKIMIIAMLNDIPEEDNKILDYNY